RSRGAWRSRRRDEEGNSPWFFSIEQSRFSDQKEVLLFAASIDDVAPPGAKSENLSSAISDKVVDRFGPLFSWLTVVRLLESYAAEVGSFRERAVRSRRPIATAKALDRYIMRDGVDVTSVCRHLERLAIDPPEIVLPARIDQRCGEPWSRHGRERGNRFPGVGRGVHSSADSDFVQTRHRRRRASAHRHNFAKPCRICDFSALCSR